MEEYLTRYHEWLDKLPEGSSLAEELRDISGNEEEIKERFYKELEFGTAGLRGILGAGTNRMNVYTVGRAAQGIADYIKEAGPGAMEKGVVIAHDPRHFSREFTELSASIFAANGINTYIFPDLRATPELAFMVRRLGAAAGVNVTASHNPGNYNGYKVYWSDGCQVGSEIADGMTEKIQAVDYFSGIRSMPFAEGLEGDIITMLGPEYDQEYLERIESMSIHGGDVLDRDIPIVYTPLNGAGAMPFSTVMADKGFTNFYMVPEQAEPDPDFTTVGYPNPEFPEAFKLSEELAAQIGAEIIMATDPDADRFSMELREADGSYKQLNGNQVGYILVNYILEGMKENGTLPEKGAMVTSIVTSTLSSEIAASYGVKMFEALTGFKNICGKIPFLEENGYTYLFGYEESVGYAPCPDIRDKDGICAGMLIAEAAAYYGKQGKTLRQVLDEIYDRFGWYNEYETNLVLSGIEGAERIKRMMACVRSAPPAEVAGIKVVKLIDYKDGYEDLQPTNALRFFLEDGSWFAVRPSGTEPKIKFYFYTKQGSAEEAARVNAAIADEVLGLIKAVP